MWFKILWGKEADCESCKTLRQQLEFANQERQELITTITSLIKPKISYEREAQNLEPIVPKVMTASRRRALLERKDAEEFRIRNESKVIATPDEVKKLEEELGVVEVN